MLECLGFSGKIIIISGEFGCCVIMLRSVVAVGSSRLFLVGSGDEVISMTWCVVEVCNVVGVVVGVGEFVLTSN